MNLLQGFRLGHWTDTVGQTGCTVILTPEGTTASAEVRGSSPGSRELELLAPDKKMARIDAVLLTGGSAFGLASADGVMRLLEEQQVGYRTPWGVVPIVPTAVLFDLNVGSATARPDAASGRAACLAARSDPDEEGSVGAARGATVGKWYGIEGRMKGGFGLSELTSGDLIVQSCVAVNAVGDIMGGDGAIIAGARRSDGTYAAADDPFRTFRRREIPERSNTTLAVVMTNARLTKTECFRVAQRMHDGFARSIVPVHTSYDGDVSFVLSHGDVLADLDLVAEMAAACTADAIRRAVIRAGDLAGIPGASPAA